MWQRVEGYECLGFGELDMDIIQINEVLNKCKAYFEIERRPEGMVTWVARELEITRGEVCRCLKEYRNQTKENNK